MPMLLVIQKGYNNVKVTNAADIVYCVSTVESIKKTNPDFVFTDGHAVDRFTAFFSNMDSDNVESLVDFKAVKIRYWIDEKDLDLKRRKEAEFLVKGDIPVTALGWFIVYNKEAKSRLQEMGIEENMIIVKPNYYF